MSLQPTCGDSARSPKLDFRNGLQPTPRPLKISGYFAKLDLWRRVQSEAGSCQAAWGTSSIEIWIFFQPKPELCDFAAGSSHFELWNELPTASYGLDQADTSRDFDIWWCLQCAHRALTEELEISQFWRWLSARRQATWRRTSWTVEPCWIEPVHSFGFAGWIWFY